MAKIVRQKKVSKKAVTKSSVAKKKGATSKTKRGMLLDLAKPVSTSVEYLKLLVYGLSGSGKTTLWATFPGPRLVIIFSGSKTSGELLSLSTEQKEDTREIRVSPDQLGQVYKELEQDDYYQTVILDHVTGLQDALLVEIAELDEIPEQYSWGIASREQWGQVAVQMKQHLRGLLNFERNVVIVGQQRTFDSDEDNDLMEAYVSAAVTPSVANWLHPAVDYIGQMCKVPQTVIKKKKIAGKIQEVEAKTGKTDYCLRVGPSPTYTTKFRKPKGSELPTMLVDPSYTKILEIINS